MKIKNFFLSLVVVLLWSNAGWAISLVEAEWLKDNLNDKNIRIVDVSNKADTYEKGHIPGAVKVNRYLDLSNTSIAPTNHYPTKEQFEKLMAWPGNVLLIRALRACTRPGARKDERRCPGFEETECRGGTF